MLTKNLATGLTVFFVFFSCFATTGSSQGAQDNPHGCLRCHEGIEPIADVETMRELSCEFCHRGKPSGKTKEDAHEGMYENPSDYRIAQNTCGLCHYDIVSRSKKSLHATSAGIISGARYTWAAQDTKDSLYATYDIRDSDGQVPREKNALPRLKQIPIYDPSKPVTTQNHPVDDYLRNQCLRCHLWSSGHEQDGDYRASGCAACHVIYSNEGLYEGGDKAISKNEKGRPLKHKITRIIPPYQCIHCHNRGGRTGVSFIGTMESDGYGSPWSGSAGEKGGKKLHGKHYNHLRADVHYQKGMYCIDCHTIQDVHGDGNIYGKKDQAVEIECQDCHGTPEAYSRLETSWGAPLENLVEKNGKIILVSKADGKERPIPQVKDIVSNGTEKAKAAMGLRKHTDRLECYACHARWAPQCYGCHAQQNLGRRSGDWINARRTTDPSLAGKKANRRATAFEWLETRSYLRWESPALGINAEGKVAPFVPGCQAIFTQIAPDGKPTFHNKVFTTYDGLSGIATNPIQPHTVTKEARNCEDCHSNRKALGLGTGIYDSKANGLDIPFELERIVDEEGRQLQATSHYGARPFNKEELERIVRINACASCHDLMRERDIWKKVTDVTGFAENDAMHKKILKKMLKEGILDAE